MRGRRKMALKIKKMSKLGVNMKGRVRLKIS